MIDLSGIDLNLLKVFAALYQTRHVSRAAKQLRLSQPAVSMGLARLRVLLGDELFVRGKAGMVLTELATRLGPEIEQALAIVGQALAGEKTFNPKDAIADIRISVDDYLAQIKVLPMIRKVEAVAPGLRFEVVSLRDRDPNIALQGELDFAIRATQRVADGLYCKKLAQESFVVLASKTNKHVGKTLSLNTYVNLEHVLTSPFGGFNGIVDQVLDGIGLKRRVRCSVGHFALSPLLLAGTDYLLTLPTSIARVYEKQYDLKVLQPPVDLPSFSVNLHWHQRVHKSPLHRWLREQF